MFRTSERPTHIFAGAIIAALVIPAVAGAAPAPPIPRPPSGPVPVPYPDPEPPPVPECPASLCPKATGSAQMLAAPVKSVTCDSVGANRLSSDPQEGGQAARQVYTSDPQEGGQLTVNTSDPQEGGQVAGRKAGKPQQEWRSQSADPQLVGRKAGKPPSELEASSRASAC